MLMTYLFDSIYLLKLKQKTVVSLFFFGFLDIVELSIFTLNSLKFGFVSFFDDIFYYSPLFRLMIY